MPKLTLVSSIKASRPAPLTRYVIAAFVMAAVVAGAAAYHHWISVPSTEREAREAAQYQSALAGATPKVEAAFRRWSATTVDEHGAVNWSGAASALIFVDFTPETVSMYGHVSDPQWQVWARSPSGAIYTVTYLLDRDLAPVAIDDPKPVGEAALLRTLVRVNRGDLIDKFHLAQRAA